MKVRGHGLIATLCSLLAAGCSLPADGPRGDDVRMGLTRDVAVPYCLVNASTDVVHVANRHHYRLAGNFTDRRPPTTVRIGVGDVIGVTLFESAAGGLFFPAEGGNRQGNFLPLPNQTVDERGRIFVPYAGGIQAAGRTVADIQQSIVAALKDRALDPQAIVSIIDQRDARLSVLGSVGAPQRIPVSASGERVLDAIARAGGISVPGHEAWVLMERRGRIAAAPFEALIHEPANNIFVRPQDTVYVFQEPQSFVAFGATTTQNHVPFGSWRLSLAEALGKSGGLNDNQAEPSWVFLYRFEDARVLADADAKCHNLKEALDSKGSTKDGHGAGFIPRIPTIYQFDLRDPSGYFLAREMTMRNKDVVYVSNARSVEVDKFLNHLRSVNSAVADPIGTAISAYALKAAIKGGTSGAAVIVSGGFTP